MEDFEFQPLTSRTFKSVRAGSGLDDSTSALLEGLGLVNGAVFSEMIENGFQDLLISTEWDPVRLFENRGGTLREITSEVGLEHFMGW